MPALLPLPHPTARTTRLPDSGGLLFAALAVEGTWGLYVVDTASGGARPAGALGGTAAGIRAFAVVPEALFTFAEGTDGGLFHTDLAIANPGPDDADVTIYHLGSGGLETATIPAMTRRTFSPASPVASGREISTTGGELIVERTMTWGAGGYGSHTEKAARGPALTWHFAEGAQGFFHTYLLVTNHALRQSRATVTFVLEGGPPVVRVYVLPLRSRLTVDASAIPELANRAFGITVVLTEPGTAERAMYFGTPLFSGGHVAAGATAPSRDWYFAEGATGPFFTTFLLALNPGDVPVQATFTYLTDRGVEVATTRTLGPHERRSINVALEGG